MGGFFDGVRKRRPAYELVSDELYEQEYSLRSGAPAWNRTGI